MTVPHWSDLVPSSIVDNIANAPASSKTDTSFWRGLSSELSSSTMAARLDNVEFSGRAARDSTARPAGTLREFDQFYVRNMWHQVVKINWNLSSTNIVDEDGTEWLMGSDRQIPVKRAPR